MIDTARMRQEGIEAPGLACGQLCREGADEIERLKSEVAKLRGTIGTIANINRESRSPDAGIRNACDEILYG